MSKEMKVKVDADIETLKDLAVRKEWQMQENVPVQGYYGDLKKCDIVITIPQYSRMGVGFSREGMETVATYDNMARNMYGDIISEYRKEHAIERLGSIFDTEIKTQGDSIVIMARRKQ